MKTEYPITRLRELFTFEELDLVTAALVMYEHDRGKAIRARDELNGQELRLKSVLQSFWCAYCNELDQRGEIQLEDTRTELELEDPLEKYTDGPEELELFKLPSLAGKPNHNREEVS